MQVLNIFGDGQNCQNQTFRRLYQLNESKYEKSVFGKILAVMLFHMYQVFSSLLGHLHFSLHFFSTFMEQLFLNHAIYFFVSRKIKQISNENYTSLFFIYIYVIYSNKSVDHERIQNTRDKQCKGKGWGVGVGGC